MMIELRAAVEPSVFENFPGIAFDFALCVNDGVYEDDQKRHDVAASITKDVREHLSDAPPIKSNKDNIEYIEFYNSMGIKGKNCSNPIKQSYRFLKKDYSGITPIIDAAMRSEYLNAISFQLYDAIGIDNVKIKIEDANQLIEVSPTLSVETSPGEIITFSNIGVMHSPSLGNLPAFQLHETSSYALVRMMKAPHLAPGTLDAARKMFHLSARVLSSIELTAEEPMGVLKTDAN